MLNIILIFFSVVTFGRDRLRVKIEIERHEDVYELTELGVSVEHLKKNYVETHLKEKMIERVRRAGYTVYILPAEEFPEAEYHGYASMEARLDSIVQNYPAIAEKISLGQSVQGRELWALKISDNVNIDEKEPEVRFIGIIHGDEPIGCELTLYLADTLTMEYGNDPYLTSLVDDRELFLIPMMNPDGREAGSRYNANGEDLNRDFPVPDGGSNGGYVPGMEIETKNIIEWSDTMDFVLSVTYHSGAQIVNYQWDYTHDMPPFVELIRKTAIGYAVRNDTIFYNPYPSYADSGTIRGSEWYVVRGSLQDWCYDSTDCIDLTVELKSTKWPPSSELNNLWQNNSESMLWLIEHAGKGIRGVVTDYNSGEPVACSYQVDTVSKIFNNDPKEGDFYRPLLTGTYDLSFEASGYRDTIISGVEVKFDSTTFLHVQMKPSSYVETDDSIPASRYILYDVKPDPGHDECFIGYFLPEKRKVKVSICNLAGREIIKIEDENKEEGYHEIRWNCTDRNGKKIPGGIYFVRMTAGENSFSRKFLILR